NPGDAINSAVSSIVNNLTVANTQESHHNISTDNTPALQAAETGATSTASDEGMIETRHVINTNTVSETSLESFYGRSGLVTIITLSNQNHREAWLINFNEFVQLRAKLELFTYMRFDIEFTLVATLIKDGSAATTPIQLQVMYVPPGSVAPPSQDSYQWQTAANPSVFFNSNGVPARFSIPFIGTANAYANFYDGYNGFGAEQTVNDYGRINSSHMGHLAVRGLALFKAGETLKLRVYAKLKHVRAWCPRAPRMCPYTKKATNVAANKTSFVNNRSSVTNT
ncbi:VP1 protein, partial [Enterovirus G]